MSKINKRIFAILVAFTLTINLLPSLRVNAADEVDSGNCGPDLTWSLNSEGLLTISGEGVMNDWSYSVSPKIYTPWNSYVQSITSVTIEDGVTSIGNCAFNDCTNLKTITIPDSVTSIGKLAFYSCESLKTVSIPNSVTSIGSTAFCKCTSLESITIPNSVTSIGTYVFQYCSSLETVTLPDNVTSIGEGFFEGCTSLESISIPNSVTSIGRFVFKDCARLESITIPNGVTSIGASDFRNCTSLKCITIPESVTSIDGNAFEGCTSLESITIPDSVTSIGDLTFRECTSLESITIPESVTSIGAWAFYGCTSLESITIPNSVTSIGKYAFYGCKSLESITIPDSVTSIGSYAFLSCTSLESILLPRNCSMGDDVFMGCNADLKLYYYYDATYKTDGIGEIVGNSRTYFGDELTITPDPYFVIDQVTYKDANGKEGTIDPDADGRYFMPDSDSSLTVTASFKRVKADVTFLSEDGKTELQSTTYDVNVVPSYEGEEPSKEPDAQYTYSFAGWTDGTTEYGPDDLPPVTDNVDYKAVFESTTNKYTIEFVDEDGKVLQTGKVDYGTTPSYGAATPVKSADDKYTYEFSGWSPAIVSVTGDATYKAVFKSTEKSEPTNTPIKKEDTPVPVNKPGTYYLKSMVEQDGNIIFTIKQSEDDTKTYDLLGTVSSDGTKLTEGDQYTAEKGSAIITVKKSYLDTLTTGNHKLTVTFTDGGTITITYEVKAPAQESKPAETKAAAVTTGEVIAMTSVAGAVMLIISCGIAITVFSRRKRAEEE